MDSRFYAVKCLTNLHMGSGDVNFNIVDNEVQRDPVTGYPVMHSSGMKGAFREYFGDCAPEVVKGIFGAEPGQNEERLPGKLRFLSAVLLWMPVRATKGSQVYYLAATKESLSAVGKLHMAITGRDLDEGFLDAVEKLDPKCAYSKSASGEISVEGFKENLTEMPKAIGAVLGKLAESDADKLIILPDKTFASINLPVLARNQLNNGISKNLWYEEVVPHDAVFVFGVLSDGTTEGDDLLGIFDKKACGNLVQFGANASVGYGLTKVMPFGTDGRE
ncbi:MAG: type III-B CRISPR module RAMP protein Cmr4 [Lachnospiraceae bacterium]|nr:type III-B CRISPR module RAMP protein Cmr4 [Lachnospiraceae bacterium]